MNNKLLNIIILLLPLILISVLICIFKTDILLYEKIGTEDGILEWSQFGFYIFSGLLSLVISIKYVKRNPYIFVLYLLATLALLFIALEEISWGERVFGNFNRDIIPDAILENNVQNETNIHNIELINNKIGYVYLLICFYGCLSWLLYWILGKVFSFSNSFKEVIKYISPTPLYILYFLPLVINLFGNHGFRPQTYEVAETLLSLGLFMYIINLSMKN